MFLVIFGCYGVLNTYIENKIFEDSLFFVLVTILLKNHLNSSLLAFLVLITEIDTIYCLPYYSDICILRF